MLEKQRICNQHFIAVHNWCYCNPRASLKTARQLGSSNFLFPFRQRQPPITTFAVQNTVLNKTCCAQLNLSELRFLLVFCCCCWWYSCCYSSTTEEIFVELEEREYCCIQNIEALRDQRAHAGEVEARNKKTRFSLHIHRNFIHDYYLLQDVKLLD